MSIHPYPQVFEQRRKKNLFMLGVIVVVSGILGIAADVLSAWSDDPRGMSSAFAVDFDSVKFLFINKPRWHYILGNYFGTFILPIFHLVGMYLIAITLRPFGRNVALIFMFVGAYITAIGSGLHGTLAFIGDIVNSGNSDLALGILDYWQPWAYSLVVLLIALGLFLAAAIFSEKTAYSRWMLALSPLGLMLISTMIVFVIPEGLTGTRSFIAVTGFNVPMLIFYLTTLYVLWNDSDAELADNAT